MIHRKIYRNEHEVFGILKTTKRGHQAIVDKVDSVLHNTFENIVNKCK